MTRLLSGLSVDQKIKVTDTLGNLEQVVLTAVARLDDAYGVSIRLKVEEILGKEVRFSSIYTVLDRMEDDGYLTSWMSDSTPERGGRRKRCYRLEHSGKLALQESIHSAAQMLEVAKGGLTCGRNDKSKIHFMDS